MATDFPQSGDDETISLGNSRFDVFDHSYARDLKRNHPDIWGAGGNIRGNEAFEIWKRAERGVSSPAVLAWIKEREAWSARHFEDGKQFQDADLGPNLSNVAGIVAQVKWGTVGVLGESRMKAVLDQLKASKDERMSDEKRERVGVDQYTTEDEAMARADALGCDGTHTMEVDGETVFMPCSTHAASESVTGGGGGGGGYSRSAPAEKLERRAHQEVKLESGETADTIVGYASVFDSESRDLGDFVEYIKPGAFTRAINEQHDVRALVDHDPKMILGRTKSGTLRLSQDEHGLRTEIDIPNTTVGQDTLESIRRGDLDAMSFGFVVKDDNWEERDGKTVREIRDLDLFDVSVVSFPAYEDTTVAVRGLKREAMRRDTPKPEMLRLYLLISDGVAE
jgi:HK97 family phage prohead protease